MMRLTALVPDFICRYGKWLRARIRHPGCVIAQSTEITSNSVLEAPCRVYSGARLWEVSLGRCSYVGIDSIIVAASIGRFVSIAPRVVIGGGVHPVDEWVSTSPWFFSKHPSAGGVSRYARQRFEELPKTIVGSDVWVGYNATILPGVRVGDGAIVGAGSVVTHDVPPYAIVAGVPARILRYRFPERERKQLVESHWWDRSPDELEQYFEEFSNYRDFLGKIGERTPST